MRSGTSPTERSVSLQASTVKWSMAATMKGDSSVTDLPRAYAPITGRSTLTRSNAAARRRISDAGAAMQSMSAAQADTDQAFEKHELV